MKGIHQSKHQDYIEDIQRSANCDFQEAVIIAICLWYHNKGYDVKKNLTFRNAVIKNGIDGNLWLLDELFEKDPNLFPLI